MIDENWDGKYLYLKARVTYDPDELESRVKEILIDRRKLKELEDAHRRVVETEAEIEKNRAEIAQLKAELAQNSGNAAMQQKYQAATNKLSAQEYFMKWYNAMRNGAYELDAEHYQKGAAIDPNYAETWYNLGIIYDKQKNYSQAIQHYQKAVDIDLNMPMARYIMGNIYAEQKKI